MHHQRKRATHIHWNILTWECDVHGPHRVIVSGLDEMADVVADFAINHSTEHGGHPHQLSRLIPLDEAGAAAAEGMDWDDLPF